MTDRIFYSIESLIYLLLFVAVVFTLRGIRREIKRIADRMEEPE